MAGWRDARAAPQHHLVAHELAVVLTDRARGRCEPRVGEVRARGPLPPSPEQAIALLEQTVIPHFEYVLRLKTEGKILAGGLPVGDRAFVFIIEAPSNDEPDRIVRDMPAWGLLEWKVTPLQSVEARAEMERKVVQALKSAR